MEGRGHPDFSRINQNEKEIVKQKLGSDGLPVFNKSDICRISASSFNMWYRDYPGINHRLPLQKLVLTGNSDECAFQNNLFFPVDNIMSLPRLTILDLQASSVFILIIKMVA